LGAPVLSAACSVRINVRKILQDKAVSHPSKIYTKRASILLHKEVHTALYIKYVEGQLFKVKGTGYRKVTKKEYKFLFCGGDIWQVQ
jgi:hypothetical protein